MRRRGVPSLLVAMAIALAAGCVHAPASVAAAPEVKLMQPLPGLFTAGQPGPQDWKAIKARGVRTVINLRTPQELQGRDEAAEVRAAGMRYIELPVNGADGLTRANAQLLHEALRPGHQQVLLHCASANRAGGLLALEQADFDGVPADAALALGRKAGMTSTEARVQQELAPGHQE